MEAAGPLVQWTPREIRHATAEVSTDRFRCCLNALLAWLAACSCLLDELPFDLQDHFRLFVEILDTLRTEVVLTLGRTYTSPQMTLQWRQSDRTLIPTQCDHLAHGLSDLLAGVHLQIADVWTNLFEQDCLHFGALVEAVSGTSEWRVCPSSG